MFRKLLPLWLVLPLLTVVLSIVRAELHRARATTYRFEAEGYDPRDMLRGHYINFRLKLDLAPALSACDDASQACCYCLAAASPPASPKLRLASCEQAQDQCDAFVQRKALLELRRYYVPEARALKMTERFQAAAREHRARLEVAVDAHGKPQIVGLLVDEARIEDAR